MLIRHRKVFHLAALLDLPPVTIIGHLHALWHTVLEQQEDGDLSAWENRMIAQAAAYTGDADHFVTQLQTAKWLDDKVVHDWLDYTGRYLTNKYRRSNPRKLKSIFARHQTGSKPGLSPAKVRPKPDNLTNLTNLTEPDLTRPTKPTEPTIFPSAERLPLGAVTGVKEKILKKPKRLEGRTNDTWDAYAAAYQLRYGIEPIRNGSTNGMLAKFLTRIPLAEAPAVAAFYVTHNGQFYVTKRHPVNLLLADAEGLRTQWATGVKATSREAKNAEFQDNLVGQVDRVNRILEERTERRCKSSNGLPCEEAPIPGSSYCQSHKDFYAGIRARMATTDSVGEARR